MSRFFRKHKHNHNRGQNLPDQPENLAKIGQIVQSVNSVELEINSLIAEFYAGANKKQIFLDDFMFAGRLRLNDKLKIFKSILNRKNIAYDDKSIENYIHIRNMVAHGLARDNSSSDMLFNGNLYNIHREFADFEKYHQRMVILLEKCRRG